MIDLTEQDLVDIRTALEAPTLKESLVKMEFVIQEILKRNKIKS
jgi:hypothetical protein